MKAQTVFFTTGQRRYLNRAVPLREDMTEITEAQLDQVLRILGVPLPFYAWTKFSLIIYPEPEEPKAKKAKNPSKLTRRMMGSKVSVT